MNKENLKKVRDRIEREPDERTHMRYWSTEMSDCGTVHCIGGWACAILIEENPDKRGLNDLSYSQNWAKDWLDLTDDQVQSLFCPPQFYEEDPVYTKTDILNALDSLIEAEDEAALPVWPKV